MHRMMEADDDDLASETCACTAGEQQVVHAGHSEAVRQQHCEQVLPDELPVKAGDGVGQQGRQTHAVGAALLSAAAPQESSMTMLDVAVAWRKLPAQCSDRELALRRMLHVQAHGVSCTCSAEEKPPRTDRRWQVATRPVTSDRRPISASNQARWAELPFDFEALTARPIAPPAASARAAAVIPEAKKPVDPAAAAAAASEQLPLYLRRGQGPPTRNRPPKSEPLAQSEPV